METNQFKILLNSRAFETNDILSGKKLMRVIGDPEQVVIMLQSRWWIMRMWRKFWKIEKKESTWKYTVKLIDNEREPE